MTSTLLRKEWQQHWSTCLLLALFTFALTGVIAATGEASGRDGSFFMTQLMLLRFILPIVAWITAQRLVTLEFREKTQLFLEALPLSRPRLIAVKYATGLGFSLLLMLATLTIVALLSRSSEQLSVRFLAILASRTTLWTAAVFSFFFLTGFFGRYRFLLLLAIGIVYGLVDYFTDFRPSAFGPFVLIDGRFPYEAHHFPAGALGSTALFALGFAIAGFFLGVARDGTIGARLGERMAQSEKLFIGGLFVVLLGVVAVAGQRNQRKPFDLPGATEESRDDVVVKVAVNRDEERARGATIGARTAEELAALRSYLGTAAFPGVFIALRTDFEPGQVERVTLDKSQDLVLRANFTAPNFVERDFLDAVVRELLLLQSRDRLRIERQAWVLDGFIGYWRTRDDAAARASLLAAARAAAPQGVSRAEFAAWRTFAQRIGEKPAQAVAASALDALERQHGREAARQFLRSALRAVAGKDARATWDDLMHPVTQRLAKAAGVSFEEFFDRWQEEFRTP